MIAARVVSSGSAEIQHWRLKYALGFSFSGTLRPCGMV
jgi:hypothetical protein